MRAALVVPGPLDRRSGGYSYDVDLVEHLNFLGHRVDVWSLPAGSRRRAAEALARHLETERPDFIVFDALVHPGTTRLLELVRPRFQNVWIALVHHLAWLEDTRTGFKTRGKQKLEHRFLEVMDGFLFNSFDTGRSVAELRGPEAPFKPSIICRPPLGAVPETYPPTGQGRLLFLGNLVPRKNLDGLLKALVLLLGRRPDLDWSLTVAGSTDLDPGYARKCRLAESAGLAGRVVWAGRVDEAEREALWAKTDLLVLPSFHEGWGMAHAEALVRGVVALAVPQGGVTEVLGNAGLWSASDARALAAALEGFLDNPEMRDDLARKARLRGKALSTGGTGFDALGGWLESLAASKGGAAPPPVPFNFEAYLEAKAAVDSRSLHPRVLEGAFSGTKPGRVVELGGGTGTMAQRLRELGKVSPETVYELVDLDAEGLAAARRRCGGLFSPGNFTTRHADLLAFCEQNAASRPDLVVAHAVLDLFDAATAAHALALLGARRYWLTHLFDGLTAWEPVIDPDLDRVLVDAYHRSMDERAPGRGEGSSRSGRDWLLALPRAGLQVFDAGASDWIVRPVQSAYSAGEEVFLRSLLHFFRSSLSVRRDVDQAGLAWWLAVREAQIKRGEATLVVHQLDLAAELI